MRFFIGVLLFGGIAFAQAPQPQIFVNTDPSTTPGFGFVGSAPRYNYVNGKYWNCKQTSGRACTWTQISGGGGATIQSTTLVLVGDNAGNAIAGTPGVNYVIPSGNVATATAFAATPTGCGANLYAFSIAANGNLGCGQVAYSQVTGTPALFADPGVNGFVVRTALNTTTARTLQGTSSHISISNQDGTGGNPTFDLIPTAVTPGTYGTSTQSPQITIDADGRITNATNVAISAALAPQYTSVAFATTLSLTATSNTLSSWQIGTGASPMTGNITTFTISGQTAGQYLQFEFHQCAAGGCTVVAPTGFPADGGGHLVIGYAPNAVTELDFLWTTAGTAVCLNCTSGPTQWTETVMPAGPPPSGFGFTVDDSTSHFLRFKDPSGNLYAMAKELSAGNVRASGGTNTADSAATSHNLAVPRVCLDSSGSGTAQSCTTSPSFTPAAGDEIIYKTTTTNTGALTINVNSTSAVATRKWQGTALASGDLVAGVYVPMTYDGTFWQVGGNIGNAPAGGGGTTLIKQNHYALCGTDAGGTSSATAAGNLAISTSGATGCSGPLGGGGTLTPIYFAYSVATGTDGFFGYYWTLPDKYDSTGQIDVNVEWLTAGTSGNAFFSAQTFCIANGALFTPTSPAWTTAVTATSAAGGTNSFRESVTLANLNTNSCAAGNTLLFLIGRKGSSGSDTLGSTLYMLGFNIKWRELI